MTVAAKSTMPSLFRRLKKVGYDQEFLRRVVLPDWWEDSLADDPATRWQMELRIAQRLSLPVADLADPSKALTRPSVCGVRLKRAKAGTALDDVAPAMIAARNLVRLLLPHLPECPKLPMNLTAKSFQRRILACRRPVDLAGLVHVCWESGIAVFHLGMLPKAAKKFAGLAYFEGKHPVIVLASGHDAPARLAFHLAHEVAHILRRHVKPGGAALVDSDLDKATEDQHEREADGDALEILTGHRNPSFSPCYGLRAPRLMLEAREFGGTHGIHPGTVALIYGKTAGRMPVAIKALKLMNMDSGGRAIIAEALEKRVRREGGGHQDTTELPGSADEVLPLFGVDCKC